MKIEVNWLKTAKANGFFHGIRVITKHNNTKDVTKMSNKTIMVFKGLLACALLGCANLFAGPALPNVKTFKQMENPAKWEKNSAPGKVQITFDKKESAILVQVTFNPKIDRWIYPRYYLQLPQESLKGAKTLSFEWKIITEKPLAVANVFVMTKDKNGKYKNVWFNLPKQTGKWVKCNIALNKGLDPATITALHIGLNPTCDKILYYFRNIRFTF